MRRTRKQIKEIVIKYIRENNNVTVSELQDKLDVNIHRTFGGIKNAFNEANVKYPIRKTHDSNTVKSLVIASLRNNPLVSIENLQKSLKISFYKHFRRSQDAYKLAGVNFCSKSLKRRLRKQNDIMEYIKSHPKATQWEINKDCRTHVQEIFNGGIKEAFRRAKINYPFDRLKTYGIAKKKIKHRSSNFENKILNKLKSMGARIHVKTINGIVDAIIKINRKLYVVEVKDYKIKPISLSDIKQVNKYLNDLNCKNGIIICSGNRNIDRVKFNSNKILILPEKYTSRLDGVIKDMTWD